MIRIENLDVLADAGSEARGRASATASRRCWRGRRSEFDRQVQLARRSAGGEAGPDAESSSWKPERQDATAIFAAACDAVPHARPIPGETPKTKFVRARAAADGARSQSLNQIAPRPVPPATPEGPWQTVFEADKDGAARVARPARRRREPTRRPTALRDDARAPTAEDDAPKFNDAAGRVSGSCSASRARGGRARSRTGRARRGERPQAGRAARPGAASRSSRSSTTSIRSLLCLVAVHRARSCWRRWRGSAGPKGSIARPTGCCGSPSRCTRSASSAAFTFPGRPPVTNLYSSAVFIGWAAVLLGLLFEAIYRLGIGNLLAAVDRLPDDDHRLLPDVRSTTATRSA